MILVHDEDFTHAIGGTVIVDDLGQLLEETLLEVLLLVSEFAPFYLAVEPEAQQGLEVEGHEGRARRQQ